MNTILQTENVQNLLKNFSLGFEDYSSSPMISFHRDNATTFPFPRY